MPWEGRQGRALSAGLGGESQGAMSLVEGCARAEMAVGRDSRRLDSSVCKSVRACPHSGSERGEVRKAGRKCVSS